MTNDWNRGHETLVGLSLTSRWSGRRVAATEHCVAVVRSCATCGNSWLMTAAVPTCPQGCAPPPVETRQQAPTVVTGI